MLSAYKNAPAKQYNFDVDPIGEYTWYAIAKEYTSRHPISSIIRRPTDNDELFDIVSIICEQFKKLVEDNGLWQLMFDDEGKAKHERAAQLLFFGIADAYCNANDIDLSREPNAGRGPVDFKLSIGASKKVVVEVKLTSNKQLQHGIETQLPIYAKQEQAKKAVYLIINNGNYAALKRFKDYYKENEFNTPYIVIDATPKDSASVAKDIH